MERRAQTRAALMVVLGASALMVLAPATAEAQSELCDPMVIDHGQVLEGRFGEVERAAALVADQSALVRVRSFRDVPGGDLDARAADLIARCESWRRGTERAPELLLVMVSVDDRKTGAYYGSRWNQALDGEWSRIQAEVMNPRFAEGDIASGLVTGLDAMRRQMAASVADAPARRGVEPGPHRPDGFSRHPSPNTLDEPDSGFPSFGGLLAVFVLFSIGVAVFDGLKGGQPRRRGGWAGGGPWDDDEWSALGRRRRRRRAGWGWGMGGFGWGASSGSPGTSRRSDSSSGGWSSGGGSSSWDSGGGTSRGSSSSSRSSGGGSTSW